MSRIQMFFSPLASVAAATVLLAACASTSGTNAPVGAAASAATPAPDCAELGAQIVQVEQGRRAALEQQRDAWKVVVPFAVAARHARAKHAVAEAELRLAELQAEFGRRGCDRQGA
jgi:hypothetical protein